MIMKTDNGVSYPASAYAYCPDAKKPDTWKLRLKNESGQYDMEHLAAAAAALSPGGFRGQTVALPAQAVSAVKAKIRAGYRKLGKKPADYPESIRQAHARQADLPNELSIGDMFEAVLEALDVRFLTPDGMTSRYTVQEIYPDRVIVQDLDGELWQLSFQVSGGQVTLSEPTAVTVAYVPAAQTAGDRDVRILQAVDKQGWEWEVLILKPGLGGNNQYFPETTLRQAVKAFEGARVFCLDDEQHSEKLNKDKSAKQIVGWIKQVRYVDGKGLMGHLHLLPTADWLRQNLMATADHGKPDLYGLSADAPCCKGSVKQIREDGKTIKVMWFTEILADPVPPTVDVVWNPGTPGGFQRALNAKVLSATTEEEVEMKKLLAILQAKRPDLLMGVDQAAITEEQLNTLLDKAMEKPAAVQQAISLSDEDRAALKQARVMQWNGAVRDLLADSKLPEVMQADLRTRFMDEPGDTEKVKQAITAERGKLDALGEEGKVKGLGTAHEITTESEVERLQQSMDKLFGLDVKGDAPAFTGIRQAYERITGDVGVSGVRSTWKDERLRRMAQAVRAFQTNAGLDVDGNPKPGFVRIEQAQYSTSWPFILGNTMARRVGMDYAEVDYGESRLISNKRRANDFRTLEIVRPQYPADLPTVDPETGDYLERAVLTEEEVAYSVTTRGGIMTVSRKVILNDDLGAVMRVVRNEGRAARRTHARVLWNLAKNNATYDGDSKAWFHADHANLGSVALTADATGVTEMVAALQRMMDMTEPGSLEKLGGAWWNSEITLAVPGALAAKAKQINQSEGIPGAANQGDNPVYGAFGNPETPERILVIPLFTDATDWYLFRDPREVEIIEVAYLLGQEQPEVFVADQATVGQMFLADKSQFKIRHEYGAEIADYRGAQKNVVAG